MAISLVKTEQNWNANSNLPVTHSGVKFDLDKTGNRAIFSFTAECKDNTYTGHLHLVPDEKNFPDIEKFHITIVTCNNKNVKTNYFGDAENTTNGIRIVDAKTDGGNKQEKYSKLPPDIKPGLTLLLQNDIFFQAVT